MKGGKRNCEQTWQKLIKSRTKIQNTQINTVVTFGDCVQAYVLFSFNPYQCSFFTSFSVMHPFDKFTCFILDNFNGADSFFRS
jgi:hypothetical protein